VASATSTANRAGQVAAASRGVGSRRAEKRSRGSEKPTQPSTSPVGRAQGQPAFVDPSVGVLGQAPGDRLGEGVQLVFDRGNERHAVLGQAALVEPRLPPLPPLRPRVEPGVPGRVAAASDHGELAGTQCAPHLAQQAQLPGAAVDARWALHRLLPTGGDERPGRVGGHLAASLRSHGPEDRQGPGQLGAGGGGLEGEGVEHSAGEAAHVGEAVSEDLEELLGPTALAGEALSDQLAQSFQGDSAEDLRSHRLGGDGGVEHHLGHLPEQACPLRLSLGVLEPGLRQVVVAAAEDAPDEDVEHLHHRVGDLLGPHGEESEQQGVALVGRVAPEGLGVEAPGDPRPLPPSVGRDAVPVQVVRQGGPNDRQPLALGDHGGGRRSSGWSGQAGERAVAVVGGAEGVESFSLPLSELAGDVGEQPEFGLGARRVHQPFDRRLAARAQQPLAHKPVLRRVHERRRVARVGHLLGDEGAQARIVLFPERPDAQLLADLPDVGAASRGPTAIAVQDVRAETELSGNEGHDLCRQGGGVGGKLSFDARPHQQQGESQAVALGAGAAHERQVLGAEREEPLQPLLVIRGRIVAPGPTSSRCPCPRRSDPARVDNLARHGSPRLTAAGEASVTLRGRRHRAVDG
jgi:hypothetical protein